MTTLGNNVNIDVKGTKLIIEIDLKAEGSPSKSGQNIVIASTAGNKAIATPNGQVTLGLNLYKAKAK